MLYIPDPGDEEALANGITGGVPAMIISLWGDFANLRVFTDSEAVLWRTSVPYLESFDGDVLPGGCWILK